MKKYTLEEIEHLPSRERAHFINSITGYKSANLIATRAKNGVTNLAVFSSVIHLGSTPPLLGFILRPTTVPRNTYDNLRKTKKFTVNHINQNIIRQAHHTAAKYDGDISEFEKSGLTEEYLDEINIPFVKESHIKLSCSYKNEYYIKENDCHFIIGAIDCVYLLQDLQAKDGWVNLEKAQTVAINGLDAYALPQILDRLSYAQPDEQVTSIFPNGS